MNKTIIFVLDSFELYDTSDCTLCYSWEDTEKVINRNLDNIVTYDLSHFSFDLTDFGYNIYGAYNGQLKKFEIGMTLANGKELRKPHNLLRLFIGGELNDDLKITKYTL